MCCGAIVKFADIQIAVFLCLKTQVLNTGNAMSTKKEVVVISSDDSTTNAVTKKLCENCEQPVNGEFCSACGQSLDSTLKYFWVVILHLLDDILSFDSRASRTLWPLIFRPGFLTKEYFAGRRVHYVPPLRLYLFISIVFFLTLKLTVSGEEKQTVEVNNNQVVISQIAEHIKMLNEKKSLMDLNPESEVNINIADDLARFDHYLDVLNRDVSIANNTKLVSTTRQLALLELQQAKLGDTAKNNDINTNKSDISLSFDFLSDANNKQLEEFTKKLVSKAQKTFTTDTNRLINEVLGKLPQLMFVLLPIFALLLKVLFIFSRRLYMEHLTVALHSHSFIFVSLLLIDILNLIDDHIESLEGQLASVGSGIIGVIIFCLLIWIPVYLFIMQKRIYKQGYILAIFSYGFVSFFYFILMAFITIIAIIWGLTEI